MIRRSSCLGWGAVIGSLSVMACSSDDATTATSGTGGTTVTGSGTTSSTGVGAGGSGSGGGSTSCEPGSTRACYDGPAGTDDVGACKGGSQTCAEDGSGFGPCEGQVLPAPETCQNAVDDDCDGKVNETGEGCVCKPKSSSYCYDGDPKTENVGPCVGGIRTCNEDGTAWGPCEGQVLPAAESCSTPLDEDCDGKTPLCAAVWTVTAGDLNSQLVHGIAVDGAGNTLLVGELAGSMTLGNLTLTSLGGADAFVVKLDPKGMPVWGFRYGEATNSQAAHAVAVDGEGNVLVTGYFRTSVNFGGSTLTSLGGSDVFVAKLDGKTGAQLWAQRFGNASDDQIGLGIAVDTAGNPHVTGAFAGTMTFGANVTAAGVQDGFVAKLAAATGTATWGAKFGGTDYDYGRDVAVDAMGNVFVVGDFSGAFSLAGKNLASAGASDVLVARFDGSTGAANFAGRYGSTGFDFGRALAIAKAGGPLFSGEFEGSVDFGGGALASAGGFDAFVLEVDTAGTHLQSKRFGGLGDESALDLAVDHDGNVLLGGFTTGSVDFGTGPVTSAGGRDALAVKLTPTLSGLWARRFGDTTFYQQVSGVAAGPNNESMFGGHFSGTADFGAGPVTSTGATDAFAVAFPP